MSYRITYENRKKKVYPMKKRSARKRKIVGIFVAIVLLAGVVEWHRGTFLKKLLLPGDPDSVRQALSQMVNDIRSGESMGDAIAAFYSEIVGDGHKAE